MADQVGYGKTAITVALIDSAPKPPAPPAYSQKHAVPVKATLVFAPPHLLRQWPREVKKFTGEALKVRISPFLFWFGQGALELEVCELV